MTIKATYIPTTIQNFYSQLKNIGVVKFTNSQGPASSNLMHPYGSVEMLNQLICLQKKKKSNSFPPVLKGSSVIHIEDVMLIKGEVHTSMSNKRTSSCMITFMSLIRLL